MSEDSVRPNYEQVCRELEGENKELKMQVQELSCHIQYREKKLQDLRVASPDLSLQSDATVFQERR